jgi:hypothetical protein
MPPREVAEDRRVPVNDFSGLVSTNCALSAAARAAIDSLDRCIFILLIQHLEADRSRRTESPRWRKKRPSQFAASSSSATGCGPIDADSGEGVIPAAPRNTEEKIASEGAGPRPLAVKDTIILEPQRRYPAAVLPPPRSQ